jgi:hypothetical protein
MSTGLTINGDAVVSGSLRLGGGITPLKQAADLLTVEEKTWTIPWTLWRVHDAINTNLPAAAGTDDLGLVAGTLGTNAPSIQSLDFGGTTTTAYARAQLPIPADYVAGQSLKIRFHAGMLTTVADTTCSLDMVAYRSDEESLVGADLASAGAANNIKSLTFADVDFTITPSGLNPGDMLDVRISVDGADTGNLGVMAACIGAIQMVYYGRG